MEALEFLKEYKRMCESHHSCMNCPIHHYITEQYKNCREVIQKNSEEVVKMVETWAKENPAITNAKKFEEIFGIKPENAEMPYKGRQFPNWWDEPYKEPDIEHVSYDAEQGGREK